MTWRLFWSNVLVVRSNQPENNLSYASRFLKIGLWAPLEEWIWDTITVESHYPDDAWLGEVMSRGLKRNRNARCFHCSKQSHLKRDCTQSILRNYILSNTIPTELPAFLDYAQGVAKAGPRLMNVDQQGTVTLCCGEMPWGASQRPPCWIWFGHFLSLLRKPLPRAIKELNA